MTTLLLLLLIRTSSSCALELEEGAGLSGREDMRAFCCAHVSLRNDRGEGDVVDGDVIRCGRDSASRQEFTQKWVRTDAELLT